ncbi:hypothetical protein E2C01_071464 [Portunus trituberculatus]|uniref:Uncharacterized protein n=1 Tax=Portunus trituberculatus TaxID=210409 RepID=A0A5B7I4I3_PORTR|nr:hypothetical protein [Portunus trituberculatus]
MIEAKLKVLPLLKREPNQRVLITNLRQESGISTDPASHQLCPDNVVPSRDGHCLAAPSTVELDHPGKEDGTALFQLT